MSQNDTTKTSEPRMCRCGRAPWRKGQRNCQPCNLDANRKYRASLARKILPDAGTSLGLQK